MDKKINWKNVTITMLTVGNLFLSLNGSQQHQKINKLESDVFNLKNELVTLDEETGQYYFLYKETLNDLYMLQVESGLYNESETNVMRNPTTGKIETILKNNQKNDNY